jgi:hypothetical protein
MLGRVLPIALAIVATLAAIYILLAFWWWPL